MTSYRDRYNHYYFSQKYYADNDRQNTYIHTAHKIYSDFKKLLAGKVDPSSQGLMPAATQISIPNQQSPSFVGDEYNHLLRDLQSQNRESSEISAGRICYSVEQMAYRLGLGLTEISHILDTLSDTAEDILEVLTESQTNESRQFYYKGVSCFDKNKFIKARNEFEKAIQSNCLNFMAYKYLGRIGVELNDPDYSKTNFEEYVEFSPQGRIKADALSLLAQSHFALGYIREAERHQKEAIIEDDDDDSHWYNLARYQAQLELPNDACCALREAIELNWSWWLFAIDDLGLDPIRKHVSELLYSMKMESLAKTKNSIDILKQVIQFGDSLNIITTSEEIKECERLVRIDDIYCYLEADDLAISAVERLFDHYESALTLKIETATNELQGLEKEIHNCFENRIQPIREIHNNAVEYLTNKTDDAISLAHLGMRFTRNTLRAIIGIPLVLGVFALIVTISFAPTYFAFEGGNYGIAPFVVMLSMFLTWLGCYFLSGPVVRFIDWISTLGGAGYYAVIDRKTNAFNNDISQLNLEMKSKEDALQHEIETEFSYKIQTVRDRMKKLSDALSHIQADDL